MVKEINRIVDTRPWHRPRLASFAGVFLLAYFVFLLVFRYSIRGMAGAYDVFWACNVALVVAGYGMLTRNATIIAAAVGIIAMAHFLWMLDVGFYLALDIWPVGLAKYITWPTTSRLEILSTLHHVWFIPLCFSVLYKNGRLESVAWRYSLYLGGLLIVVSYMLTPLECDGVYLNINCAHQFWKDIPNEFLHSFNPPKASWPIYAIFLFIFSSAVNSTLFFFWRQVQFIFWPVTVEEKKNN